MIRPILRRQAAWPRKTGDRSRVRPSVVAAGFLAAVVLAGMGCGERSSGAGEQARPVVVASIYPLADLVEQIVGDQAKVACLLSPGQSPHGYEPDAADMNALGKAKLVVSVGLGLDGWTDRAADAAGYAGPQVSLAGMLGLEAGGAADHEAHDGHAHDDHHGHDHADDHAHGHDEGADPHLWVDPVLVREAIGPLRDALVEALGDPDGRIAERAAGLTKQLEDLDAAYRRDLAPFAGRAIITFHSAFNRLAERYGLKVAATLMPVESVGGLTAGRLKAVMAAVEAHDVKVIFAEPQFPADAVAVVRQQAAVKVLILDPLGDPNASGRDGYVALMNYNLQTLIAGLSAE